MINVNSVMSSLYTCIASNQTIVNSGVNVELNEQYNTDPDKMPWVGIYFGDINIEPKRVSSVTKRWGVEYTALVYVQDASLASGQSGREAQDAVERLMYPVLLAINSNNTMGGTVQTILQMQIEPFQRDVTDDNWIYTNQITLTLAGDPPL